MNRSGKNDDTELQRDGYDYRIYAWKRVVESAKTH
jgi:hypothetical protein